MASAQHPPRGSAVSRTHSRKPYARPQLSLPPTDTQSVSSRTSKSSLLPSTVPSLAPSSHQQQPDGLLAGIRSFITAPLGWMGLSSRGGVTNGKAAKQHKKRMAASSPSPPPASEKTNGREFKRPRNDPSPPFALPSAISHSSAARRYLPTSYSMNYLDAPVEDLPPPSLRSSRAAPSLSSSRYFSPAPPSSGMSRSSTMAFPSTSRDRSVREASVSALANSGSSVPKGRLGGNDAWMERYSQREERPAAQEEPPLRTGSLLSVSQPTQYRQMARSSSVFSGLNKSRRSAAIELEPQTRSRTPGGGRSTLGQMVWQPDEGFLSQKTAELRAAPPLPSTNAAERILQSLESMRSPLTEARRHFPTSSSSSELSSLPRSFSLGRIHIPTAAKEQRSKEKENRRTDVMISPYGRGKVKRDLEQGRLARSGGSRLKNVLSFSARGHRDHSEDEEEEKKKSKKQSRKAKGSKVDEKQRDYSDDEMESDRPKTRSFKRLAKKHVEEEDSDSMASDGSDVSYDDSPNTQSSAPPTTKAVDDFRPLPPNTNIDSTTRSRSALRAKSTSSRKHVSAAGSRSTTLTESSGGRFSAREEDLPDEDDLGKIKFVMPTGSLSMPAEQKESSSNGPSLLSRLDGEKKQLAKKTPNFSTAPAVSSPLRMGVTDGENEKDESPPFSFGAPLAASSSTSAFAALASNPASKPTSSGVPNFFASTLGKKTDVPKAAVDSTPKKPLFGLGDGFPDSGSTTPQSTPPPSIPNFFAKPAVESSAPVSIPSNPFAISKPVVSAPAPAAAPVSDPVSAAPAGNPFAGVGFGGSKPVETVPKINVIEPPQTEVAAPSTVASSNPFAQTKPAATPSFSFGTPAPTTIARKVSSGGMKDDMMEDSPEKPSGQAAPASTPAPVAAPLPTPSAAPSTTFSFGASSTKPAVSSPFAFGAPASAPAAPVSPTPSSDPAIPAVPAAASKPATGFSFGAPSTTAGSSSPFSFGASPTTTDTLKPAAPAPSTSTFSFGAPSTSSTDPAAPKPFSFGAPKPADAATPTPPPAPSSSGFFFGAPSSSTSSPAPFAFGASTSKPAEPAKPAANPFGSSSSLAPANPFGNAAAGPSTGFTFGQPASTPAAPAVPAAPVAAPAASAPSFGGFGSSAVPSASPASSFSFGKPTEPAAAPFGSTTSTFGSSPFGQSSSPAFGQPAIPSSPAFGQAAPAPTSFAFGSTSTAPSSSSFSFGAPATASNPPGSSGGFSFSSSTPSTSASNGFGAPAPPANPFGSSASQPPSTFAFGSSSGAAASPFGGQASGATTPTGGAPFTFGAGPAGAATPPRFDSPGPLSPAPGSAPSLFSMGAGDSAPSPGRTGPGGRPIRPLARRGAKRA